MGKVYRKVSHLVQLVFAYLNSVFANQKQILLHHLHVHSRGYHDIRWTLNLTQVPSPPHTMHISTTNKGIPRMSTDFGKTLLSLAIQSI